MSKTFEVVINAKINYTKAQKKKYSVKTEVNQVMKKLFKALISIPRVF